jgi:predicted HicB family RNase H-like nuclease
MLRLVLDTDVIVAAMRSPKGASSALLKAALCEEVILVASVTLAEDKAISMTTFPLRLPDSLKQALKENAKEDDDSINQFIITAVEEKLSALRAFSFFEKARREADLEAFSRMLNREGGEPPREGDEV